MKLNHRRVLVAAGAALVLVLGGHLRAVDGLVPCDLQQPPKSGCTNFTPLDLATELLGRGILSISNVTYKGDTISAGKFTGGTNIIGFESGVILSTGDIGSVVGPNSSDSTTTVGTGIIPPGKLSPVPRLGDVDLTGLSGGFPTFDATVLEFDFIPDKDRVFIQYVFASEEYNEFVNKRNSKGQLFNDVLAFYIGPKGDVANRVNCATIGGLPVSIQTINDGGSTPSTLLPKSHPELYINNDLDQDPPPRNTEMDGLTKVLTCQAPVVHNATYHIKLAIADTSDAIRDSNVFLRSNSFTTTPPLTIVKNTNNTNNDAGPAPLIKVGERVVWTYVVTNRGTDPLVDALTSVVVTDDHPVGPINCLPPQPAALTPGGTMTCTASGTAVLGVDDYVNVGTVRGQSPIIGEIVDTNADRYFGAQPAIQIHTLTNNTDNNVNDDAHRGPSILVGSDVVWTYEVKNIGNVTLDGVVVSDGTKTVDCSIVSTVPPSPPKTSLLAGETMICLAKGPALVDRQPDNIGTASGTIQVLDEFGHFKPKTVTDSDPDHYFGADPKIKIVTMTDGQNYDSGQGPFVLVGDDVTWTYLVTNEGNVDLAEVKVTDNRQGLEPICTIGALASGQTAAVPCTKTAHAQTGPYENTGTATGTYGPVSMTPELGDTFTARASDVDHYFGAAPELKVVKETNGTNNSSPETEPSILFGQPVMWTYRVKNTGNVSLTNIKVADVPEGPICTISLAALAETSCTKSATALKGDYTNTGTASVNLDTVLSSGATKHNPVTASDVDYYFGVDPQIKIVTRTNGENNLPSPGRYIRVGDTVEWTYEVTNTGNVKLKDVIVTDSQGVEVTCQKTTLGTTTDEDRKTRCRASGKALPDQYVNIGKAIGSFGPVSVLDTEGNVHVIDVQTVTDTEPDLYFGANPQIAIVTQTNGTNDSDPFLNIQVGKPVNWTYDVTNTGNVELSDVTVQDSQLGIAVICPRKELGLGTAEPAKSMTCTASGTAVANQYNNTGTASGSFGPISVDGTTIPTLTKTKTDDDHYFGVHPQITVVTTTNGTDNASTPDDLIRVGKPVEWTYEVRNAGNVALSDVMVKDSHLSQGVVVAVEVPCPTMPTTLEVGARIICSASGTAVADQYQNIGSANGSFGPVSIHGTKITETVTVTGSEPDHYFGADPSIKIVKKTNGVASDSTSVPPSVPNVLVGDLIIWTYDVSNTGNVKLTNIVVTDDHIGDICIIPSLASGKGETCFSPPPATKAVRDEHSNTGMVTATAPVGAPVTAQSVASYFGVELGINLVKKTNGTAGPTILAGSRFTWTYSVTNTGNVNLSNVKVEDNREGTICTIDTLLKNGGTAECVKKGVAKPGPYANKGTAETSVTIATTSGSHTVPVFSNISFDNYFGADPMIKIVKKTVTFVCVSSDGHENDHSGRRDDDDDDRRYAKGSSEKDRYGDRKSDGKDLNGSDRHLDKDRESDKDRDSRKDHESDKDHQSDKGRDSGQGCVSDKDHDSGRDHDSEDRESGKDHDSYKDRDSDRDHDSVKDRDAGRDHESYKDRDSDRDHDVDKDHKTLKRIETDNNVGTGPFVKVGAQIGWTYTVTNIGNVALTNVVVTDDREGFICTIGTLAIGQTAPACTKTGTAKLGQYENVGTATGNFGPVFVDGVLVQAVTATGTDLDHYFGAQPGIDIVKKTNGADHHAAPGPVVLAGSWVAWTYIISNIGNVPLNEVKVIDDKIGVITCPSKTLPAFPDSGATMTCSASGKAERGQYKNIGTVTGSPPFGVTGSSPFGPVTASDDDYYWGLDTKTFKGPVCR